MPLFSRELNHLANQIGQSDLTIRLHTSAPPDAAPANGRITAGGGTFETGATLTSADIADAVNGDISNSADIDFGTATEDVGTVTHWSAYRDNNAVAFGTLPNTTINNGDSFRINSGSFQFNGSTS